jgi:hypothetical protein
MGQVDHFIPGDWNAVCYECGRKRKASQLRRHWQGYWVCPEHWEARHPQDFVRGVPERATPPWVQPMPGDSFTAVCEPNGLSAVPGFAQPGCATPGYLSPMFDSSITQL